MKIRTAAAPMAIARISMVSGEITIAPCNMRIPQRDA
jgi:hypothetical protein